MALEYPLNWTERNIECVANCVPSGAHRRLAMTSLFLRPQNRFPPLFILSVAISAGWEWRHHCPNLVYRTTVEILHQTAIESASLTKIIVPLFIFHFQSSHTTFITAHYQSWESQPESELDASSVSTGVTNAGMIRNTARPTPSRP